MPNDDIEDQIRRGKYEDIYRSRATASARDPKAMKVDEIVQEVKALRETVNLASQRIVQLTQHLYTHARRNASDAVTARGYSSFATAWGRFAGAIQQGLKRTVIADRILERSLGNYQADQEAAERRQAAQVAQDEQRKRPKLEPPSPLHNPNPLRTLEGNSIDDLLKLYGAGIVSNADVR